MCGYLYYAVKKERCIMNWDKHDKYSYQKLRSSSTPLSFLLKDLDLNEYVIIKKTGNFRIIGDLFQILTRQKN